jgi:hypothetical protein
VCVSLGNACDVSMACATDSDCFDAYRCLHFNGEGEQGECAAFACDSGNTLFASKGDMFCSELCDGCDFGLTCAVDSDCLGEFCWGSTGECERKRAVSIDIDMNLIAIQDDTALMSNAIIVVDENNACERTNGTCFVTLALSLDNGGRLALPTPYGPVPDAYDPETAQCSSCGGACFGACLFNGEDRCVLSPPDSGMYECAHYTLASVVHVGCFMDHADARDLPFAQTGKTAWSVGDFESACAEFNFFALQDFGALCFCGDGYGEHGSRPDAECGTACPDRTSRGGRFPAAGCFETRSTPGMCGNARKEVRR